MRSLHIATREKPTHSSQDPVQPKMNQYLTKIKFKNISKKWVDTCINMIFIFLLYVESKKNGTNEPVFRAETEM